MAKPGVIVLSKDDDQEGFKWLSDGWYGAKKRGTERAEKLYHQVADCITIGDNVPDVVRRLEEAGFKVTRFEDMPS